MDCGKATLQARIGCCDQWRKPCSYHEGYEIGYERAEQEYNNLLEAIEGLLSLCIDYSATAPEQREEVKAARAIVANAKGETNG